MTDVIAGPCTGVKDKACAGECPAEAIVREDDVPGQRAQFTGENVRFFGQLGPRRRRQDRPAARRHRPRR